MVLVGTFHFHRFARFHVRRATSVRFCLYLIVMLVITLSKLLQVARADAI